MPFAYTRDGKVVRVMQSLYQPNDGTEVYQFNNSTVVSPGDLIEVVSGKITIKPLARVRPSNFWRLFTEDEYDALLAAKKENAELNSLYNGIDSELLTKFYIYMDDKAVTEFLDLVLSLGHIDSERYSEILNGVIVR